MPSIGNRRLEWSLLAVQCTNQATEAITVTVINHVLLRSALLREQGAGQDLPVKVFLQTSLNTDCVFLKCSGNYTLGEAEHQVSTARNPQRLIFRHKIQDIQVTQKQDQFWDSVKMDSQKTGAGSSLDFYKARHFLQNFLFYSPQSRCSTPCVHEVLDF